MQSDAAPTVLRLPEGRPGAWIKHYLLSVWVVALGIPLALGFWMAFEPSAALLFLLLGVIWIPWVLILTAFAVWSAGKRRWREAKSRIALIVALLLAVIIPRGGEFLGFCTRLAIGWPGYHRDLISLPGPQSMKLRLWNWGGYLIFDDIFLTFDGSDTLNLAQDQQPRAFQDRLGGMVPNVRWDATHLVGHYYVLDVHG